ncbi:MAG: SDR family oxidoreductase [Candidatus Sericytochromatia bacterium]|nr:SDR family oxidoreductase [Candidatus Sericytochromatia bacterium]
MNKGSNILLTGVTGFVGKVVLEELVRRKTELSIDTIYVLIREKTNRRTNEKTSAPDRFNNEVASSACFSNLALNWSKSVKIVSGDLTLVDFGMDSLTSSNLQKELNKIINCAASVEFNLPLADAAASNITSALNVLEFARKCGLLDSFVNVSTAYVSPHPGEGVKIPEELVNLPFDPELIYQSILSGTANEKELMAKTGHPNTYTFTKCISEQLLSRRKGNIPLAIVRPSIISASWQYPHPGWIDSYAAFAGFVSLIGSGLLKCIEAQENTILDIVPCDDVSNRVINTAFWHESKGVRPLIQHVVSGINRGCRIGNCVTGIESYFQRNPVHKLAKVSRISNGKSIRFENFISHTIPSTLAEKWFGLMKQPKQQRQVKTLSNRIKYLNKAFPYFTHNSFHFEASTPLIMPLDDKQYIEMVCSGVHEHLMKHKSGETILAGDKHKHPKRDLKWVTQQPHGNVAIRLASYVVRKGLRKCTDSITFDRKSFENAMTEVDSGNLLVIVPNHRSYMDFILCSYLFFSHPDLNIPIPQIAAANDFANIPFLGWFFKQTYAFYIQRGQGKEDPKLKQKIQTLVDQNQTLEFFIEGARSRSRQFLKPKRGLLRALQNTGIPCTILPISISYDLIPEERSFLSELRAVNKKKMKLRSLMKWTSRMIAGKVNLGRVHITCGAPVIMGSQTDVHQVSKDVMQELQDKTSVSSFHLRSFLHHHPVNGIDLEWMIQSIIDRGGNFIESPLKNIASVHPINELTMRYHWIHYFYSDLLKIWPKHPVLEHHISENGYNLDFIKEYSNLDSEAKVDIRLNNFLYEVFEPLTKEYKRILAIALKNNGNLATANELVKKLPNSFLPFVEEALAALVKHGIIKENDTKNGFIAGSKWLDADNFYEACNLIKNKSLQGRSK